MKYFDYAATTPCLPEVVAKMQECLTYEHAFGNPHSRSHNFGWQAEKIVEEARATIAKLIKASASEIIFTSGATESNNLAIKGYVFGVNYKKGKLLTLETEHKCVIETFRYLKTKGIAIEFLKTEQSGLINLEYLEEKLKTAEFLSISYVNNETGVMQDIKTIALLCKKHNVKLHVDAAQAFGKIEINVENIDFLSLSAHKIYGPKGIGALFISANKPKIKIMPLIHGGGQERNLRSGTLAPHLCIGFAEAAKIAHKTMKEEFEKAKNFHEFFLSQINEKDEIFINGSLNSKIPHIVNLNIPYIEGESLLMKLNEKFALASGSACASKSLEPSHVIRAMFPQNIEAAHSSIRICFGKYTTKEDIMDLISSLKEAIITLREMSPLWHMHLEMK